MKQKWLFPREELTPKPLTKAEKDALISRIVKTAQLGQRYMYHVKEVCGMIHVTYDEMQTLLNFYKLDCTIIRDTIVLIPWWSLAEYLIDPAEDVETAMYDYLKTLPHGSLKSKQSA